MALKFNGDLSTGDITQFDSETDTGGVGSVVDTTPMCSGNDYYYHIDFPITTSLESYLEKAVTGGWGSFWGEFKFRVNDIAMGSTKDYLLLHFNGTATEEFGIRFRSISSSNLNTLNARYRNTAGGAVTTLTADITGVVTNNTTATIKFQFKRASEKGNDGIIKIWIDDVLYINGTALDIGNARNIDTIQYGLVFNSVSFAGRVVDLGCLKLSTNGVTATNNVSYYVDAINGADTNTGTEASPWMTAYQANQSAVAGDEIVIVNGTKANPVRTSVLGCIDPVASGAVNNHIVVRGESADEYSPILGTKSFPPAGWTGPDGNDEYSIDVSASLTADPKRIYVCTEAAWTTSGTDAFDPRVVGLAANRATAGTAGSLNAGEYAYSAGTLYYKPKAGETFSALHIEIPTRNATYAVIAQNDVDYCVYKWLDVLCPFNAGIHATANGAGSFIANCSGASCGPTSGVFQVGNSNCSVYRCRGSWAVDNGATSGDGILCNGNGTGNIVANICHDNANDGIAFSGTHTGQCVGNVSYNNGSSAQGDQCGIEITGTSKIKAYHNTCVGNYSHGILNQSTDTADQSLRNNICAYNGSYGVNITAAQYAANADLMNYNASYGNGSFAFNAVGTGSVSPAGAITADPLLTSVVTSTGLSVSRSGDNYVLATASPCHEETDGEAAIANRYWTTGPRPEGQNNPVPDRRASMGAYQ